MEQLGGGRPSECREGSRASLPVAHQHALGKEVPGPRYGSGRVRKGSVGTAVAVGQTESCATLWGTPCPPLDIPTPMTAIMGCHQAPPSSETSSHHWSLLGPTVPLFG